MIVEHDSRIVIRWSAVVCPPRWTQMVDTNSLSGVQNTHQTVRDCQDHCANVSTCVAIDFDFNDNSCWLHSSPRDLFENNTFSQNNTTQYRINRTCGTCCSSVDCFHCLLSAGARCEYAGVSVTQGRFWGFSRSIPPRHISPHQCGTERGKEEARFLFFDSWPFSNFTSRFFFFLLFPPPIFTFLPFLYSYLFFPVLSHIFPFLFLPSPSCISSGGIRARWRYCSGIAMIGFSNFFTFPLLSRYVNLLRHRDVYPKYFHASSCAQTFWLLVTTVWQFFSWIPSLITNL